MPFDIAREIARNRKMTPHEVRTARHFIALLPYDTEVPTSFFFGATLWNSLDPRQKCALGADFSRRVVEGEVKGVTVIRSTGANRWCRL